MLSSPAMVLSSVDLPQPEGPTRTRKPPSSIARLMSLSTSTVPKPFSRRSISRNAMVLSFDCASHQATDEIAARDDIDDERRQGGENGAGEVDIVLLHARRGGHEVVERNGHRHRID